MPRPPKRSPRKAARPVKVALRRDEPPTAPTRQRRRGPTREQGIAILVAGVLIVGLGAWAIFGSPEALLRSGGSSASEGRELDPATQLGAEQLALIGADLSPQAAAALEERVVARPADLRARTELVAYYNVRAAEPLPRRRHEGHVRWLADNLPDAPVLATSYVRMTSPEAYRAVRASLLRHVRERPKELAVLRNAALFMGDDEPEVALTLLAAGQALEPQSGDWSHARGQVELTRRMGAVVVPSRAPEAPDPDLAAARVSLDGAVNLDPKGRVAFPRLGDLAARALADGDLAGAQRWAEEGLRRAPAYREDWAYGEVLHVANIVLGEIALKVGKVNVAEAYLRKAGKGPGSPRLTSGGPDTDLARALLERERQDGVLAYLQDCQEFWQRGRSTGAIARWRAEIREGKIPDFLVP